MSKFSKHLRQCLAQRAIARCLLSAISVLLLGNSTALVAAEFAPSNWLASRMAPPCPARPGVRTSRSDLVEFRQVSASISAQSAREENGSCEQSASLWVTRGEVSQQFDLPDAATNTFSLVDFAPDGSAILLYKEKAYAVPGEDTAPELALLPLAGGTMRWVPVPLVIGWANCAGVAEPQGFIGPRTLLFKATLSPHGTLPACIERPGLLAVDLDINKVFPLLTTISLKPSGRKISGPLLSCQADPDIAGACYKIKGRVGLAPNGVSLRLWQTDAGKWIDLAEGMLPEDLSSQVMPGTWVYADMLVCPMSASARKARTVCIESASGYHSEPAVTKLIVKAPAKASAAEQGSSH